MQYSYQLYSSRKFPPLADTLAMLHALGYTGVEGFGGLFGPDSTASAVRDLLDQHQLRMRTCHLGMDQVRSDPQGVIKLATTLGLEAVFVPAIPDAERVKDAAGWQELGRTLAAIGKPLQDAGLAFGWHNHAFEFVTVNSTELPLDLILSASDDLLLEFDIAWAVIGGQDPIAWIRRYGTRLIAAHLKDIAAPGECLDEDGWADVGHGTLDWPALLRALASSSARHFVMEHDNPNDHQRFARRSIESLRRYHGETA